MATGAARRRQLSAIERLGERFAQSKPGSWFYINVAMRVDRVLLPLSRGRFSISEAVDYYAGYAEYKIRAGTREIPIVVLERP
jgi:hypothetical protein